MTTKRTKPRVLTERAVASLKPGGGQLSDARMPGLAVRVMPSGVKTWRFRYRSPELTVGGRGRGRSASLGEFSPGREDHVSLAEARRVAGGYRKLVRRGVDPLEQQTRDRMEAERRRASTFGRLAEEFLAEYAEKRYRYGAAGARAALEADVLPHWRDRPAEAVTSDEVSRLVRAKARTAPVAANRLLALLSRLFSWAVEERLLAASPAAGVKRPAKEEPRERVLSDDEVRALWLAAEPEWHGHSDLANDVLAAPVAAAFRLRLLTGQRWTELVRARWEDVTREQAEVGGRRAEVVVWTIPKANTKSRKRTHVVPLSQQAVDVVEALRSHTERTGWLFPAYRGEGHMRSAAGSFRAWKRRAGVEGFIGKDVRRTMVTGMARLGVDYEVRSAVVGHVLPGTTKRVYDRYDLLPEKRAALAKWGRHVERLVTDQVADVVPLRA